MKGSTLNRAQRDKVLCALSKVVTKHLYAPRLEAINWDSILEGHRAQILDAPDDMGFEKAITEMLSGLQSSHVGFYRRDLKRGSAKAVLAASYTAMPDDGMDKWVFQNVHPGGPADLAGVKPGDILISVDGQSYQPPDHPTFAVGSAVDILLETANQRREVRRLEIPKLKPKWNQLPKVEPAPIVARRRIDSETGYLRIASYPARLGSKWRMTSALRLNRLGRSAAL
jgi:C-terminal processing protease CtpA/Prc